MRQARESHLWSVSSVELLVNCDFLRDLTRSQIRVVPHEELVGFGPNSIVHLLLLVVVVCQQLGTRVGELGLELPVDTDRCNRRLLSIRAEPIEARIDRATDLPVVELHGQQMLVWAAPAVEVVGVLVRPVHVHVLDLEVRLRLLLTQHELARIVPLERLLRVIVAVVDVDRASHEWSQNRVAFLLISAYDLVLAMNRANRCIHCGLHWLQILVHDVAARVLVVSLRVRVEVRSFWRQLLSLMRLCHEVLLRILCFLQRGKRAVPLGVPQLVVRAAKRELLVFYRNFTGLRHFVVIVLALIRL